MKTLTSCIFVLVILAYAAPAMALDPELEKGFSFSVHDFKSNDYSFPSFHFSIKTPQGETIGWNNNTQSWVGTLIESKITEDMFHYPDPGQDCSSSEPVKEYDFKLSSGIEGEFKVVNNLHCRDSVSGEQRYISSGYGGNVARTPNGRYDVLLTSRKNAMLDICFSFGVNDIVDGLNTLCTDEQFNKRVILTTGTIQAIELTYNYSSVAGNKALKVITPDVLSGSWDSCHDMGLIKNTGLYNSIRKKLDNAKKQYEKGQKKAAEHINKAAANELEAQRGKGIDALCADILLKDLRAELR